MLKRIPTMLATALWVLGGSKLFADDADYCRIETEGRRVEVVRPGADEPPIDDVNWFARPLWNDRGEWIIAFASHNQNYLYNLSTGRRIKIPDRSDAVATPDGRYMTVPSYYTSDEYIRFYDAGKLLEHLDRGVDADDLPPVFIHRHPDLRKVFYQSTGLLSKSDDEAGSLRVYRLMFSGTRSETGFRIVDYEFAVDPEGGLRVRPGAPMRLCPEIPNDMSTPFLSKDARYVVSYASASDEREYTPGASLRLYRILDTFPAEGTTRCEEVVDFGFAAGKADFSFDGSLLTFHISKGSYLTPFINGGLETPTVTDVVVVRLAKDVGGGIRGYESMARITTSLRAGVGSYFPAFLPDGRIFYVFNAEPKESSAEKRFYFKVVDPSHELFMANVFAEPERLKAATALGKLWASECSSETEKPPGGHEAPWVLGSLSREQCRSLVEKRADSTAFDPKSLLELCDLRP